MQWHLYRRRRWVRWAFRDHCDRHRRWRTDDCLCGRNGGTAQCSRGHLHCLKWDFRSYHHDLYRGRRGYFQQYCRRCCRYGHRWNYNQYIRQCRNGRRSRRRGRCRNSGNLCNRIYRRSRHAELSRWRSRWRHHRISLRMSAQLSPTPVFKGWANDGTPLAYGLLSTYAAGTTTPQATYIDSTLTTCRTPIPLYWMPGGECALWLDPTLFL